MAKSKREQVAALLSRRERQMMDIAYAHDGVTAAEVRAEMPAPPTDAAVRATLRTLVEKGHLRYEMDGPRYVYYPTVPREEARRSALRHLVATFFDGSTEGAMAALLELDDSALSETERRRINELIDRAAAEGR
ncbi:MAG: BlaI/MecI/CopY family transcriptional regulator [Acidobacteriota bacterium]